MNIDLTENISVSHYISKLFLWSDYQESSNQLTEPNLVDLRWSVIENNHEQAKFFWQYDKCSLRPKRETEALVQRLIKFYILIRGILEFLESSSMFILSRLTKLQMISWLKSTVQQKTVGEEKENTVKLERRSYLFPKYTQLTQDWRSLPVRKTHIKLLARFIYIFFSGITWLFLCSIYLLLYIYYWFSKLSNGTNKPSDS